MTASLSGGGNARNARVLHVALAWAACVGCVGCVGVGNAAADTRQVPNGDAARGRTIVAGGAYGCTGCHTIPGMNAPHGVVGPPLDGMASRAFIAGQLPNTPDVLVAFLQNPAALVPATGMPDVRLGLARSRDVAAYLYTLKASRAR